MGKEGTYIIFSTVKIFKKKEKIITKMMSPPLALLKKQLDLFGKAK